LWLLQALSTRAAASEGDFSCKRPLEEQAW
jgi:hypothetical protein